MAKHVYLESFHFCANFLEYAHACMIPIDVVKHLSCRKDKILCFAPTQHSAKRRTSAHFAKKPLLPAVLRQQAISSCDNMQNSTSDKESPLSSPDVSCYEECVVAEEDSCLPLASNGVPNRVTSPLLRVNRNTGRVNKKGRSKSRSVKDKKCSSPFILKWLDENYETVQGACLPRSVLYTHYQDFCKRNHLEPSSAASFGKIIRMKFPNLSTRRLGTRGQSKYHYYGLAIRETSIYYRSVYSKQGLTRFSGASLKKDNSQLYSPTVKTGILLPEFPKARDLNYTKPFPIEKVETFLLMYHAHCQRILDSVVRANFFEVQDFLLHFWQGMPPHMLPILNCQITVDLIVICDFLLYNRLCEVLIPANLQQLPDNLVEEILSFSQKLVQWLFVSLQDLPAPLGIRKVQTAEMFGKSLRRQTALVQLAKGARAVLRSSETVGMILNDWRSIDFDNTSCQIIFTSQLPDSCLELFKEFSCELEQLLVKQSSLEIYFEWLDSLIEQRVCEPAEKGTATLQELSQDFLIMWSNFYLVIEKEVLILKGKSFDSYRVLHAVLNDYIQYVMEMLRLKMIESQFTRVLINKLPEIPPKPEASDTITTTSPSTTGPSPLLPPIFPPTPTSAESNSDKDFLHYFETRIVHEFQDTTSFFSHCCSLQSPNFTNMVDSVYDSFFKQENMYPHPHHPLQLQQAQQHGHFLHMPPSTLDLGIGSVGFDGTSPPPLTPQSSLCSSNSPLSHISIHSPESCAMTPDVDGTRPISQASMYTVESPQNNNRDGSSSSSMAHTPIMSYSRSHSSDNGSACVSPLLHHHHHHTGTVPSCLDIASSLDLVAGPDPGCPDDFIHHGYSSFFPHHQYSPLPGPEDACHYPQQLPPSYPHNSMNSPVLECPGYSTHQDSSSSSVAMAAGRYPQYDFELHHLMSDPSVLLTNTTTITTSDSLNIEVKDVKPANLTPHTPPPHAIV